MSACLDELNLDYTILDAVDGKYTQKYIPLNYLDYNKGDVNPIMGRGTFPYNNYYTRLEIIISERCTHHNYITSLQALN